MTVFNMTRDVNGYNGFGLKPSQDMYSGIFAQGVAQTFTVPNNFQNWLAIFSYEAGSTNWLSINDTAIAPSGALASSTSECNPTAIQLKAGDTVSMLTSDTAAKIGVKLYVLL